MKKHTKRDYFVSCIVAAGGASRRMGADVNKLFLPLVDIPVLAHTLLALENSDYIDEIIVSTREENIVLIRNICQDFRIAKLKSVVKGGAERSESVKAALSELSEECDLVAVHDGARPLIEEDVIERVVCASREFGSAACGVRPKCTLKREDENGFVAKTVDRSVLYEIQTPQVFAKELFLKAYEAEDDILRTVTDDCALIERLGEKIKITEGSYRNIKITTIEDIAIAKGLLEG